MNAKTTMVTLVAGSVTKQFELSHAERILAFPRGGWELADNNFEWDGNALHRRANKKGDSGK